MSWYRKVRRPAVTASVLAAAVSAILLSLGSPASAAPSTFAFTKIEGAAGGAAGLTPTVTAFRGLLGEPNNASNPPAAAGRREINWDGTPDAQSAPNLLTADFFNTTVPRGAVFGPGQATTPGTFGFGSVSRGASSTLADVNGESTQTLPYVGIGYSGSSLRGGWGFNADLGLAAQNSGQQRLARSITSQSLDDTLRELRLTPVLQLGVSYRF